ncbi:MAG: hypothetical protein V4683_03840 [Bacteroidota bacterium]
MKTYLLIIILFASLSSFGQDSTKVDYFKPKMYSIETKDGAIIIGTVVSEDQKHIVLQTKSMGLVTIEIVNIKLKKEIFETSFKKGEYWFENPNGTRYIIGPSAFTLKKGEGYYQNLYLFGQSVNVGITDHITIGGGTEIASLLFAQEAPKILFLTPKVGFDVSPKFKMGVGALYVHVASFDSNDDRTNLGIIYGLGTIGNLDNNFTLGVGWGFHHSKYIDYSTQLTEIDKGVSAKPIITLSGMTRLSKRFGLVTENWIFPISSQEYDLNGSISNTKYDYKAFFSYGCRFMGERMAVDFGFLNNSELDAGIGIPYIDFVVKFGGGKIK